MLQEEGSRDSWALVVGWRKLWLTRGGVDADPGVGVSVGMYVVRGHAVTSGNLPALRCRSRLVFPAIYRLPVLVELVLFSSSCNAPARGSRARGVG